jgi:hypothetical protein
MIKDPIPRRMFRRVVKDMRREWRDNDDCWDLWGCDLYEMIRRREQEWIDRLERED